MVGPVAHGAGVGCSPASPLISVPWWAAFQSWVLSEVKIGAGPIGIFLEIMCAEVFARLVVCGLWGSVFGCFWAILDLGMLFWWVSMGGAWIPRGGRIISLRFVRAWWLVVRC